MVERVYVGRARAGFLDVLSRMGADITVEPVGPKEDRTADIRARSGPLVATEVGGAEVAGLIDEIPALAVAASVADGTTMFRDAAELAVKETDRIAVICSELSAVGGRVEPFHDGLTVSGVGTLQGGAVRSHGDHRIGMALAVAGLAASGPTRIEGWDAVATSYPGFEADLHSLIEGRS